jgi:hypothetical protein
VTVRDFRSNQAVGLLRMSSVVMGEHVGENEKKSNGPDSGMIINALLDIRSYEPSALSASSVFITSSFVPAPSSSPGSEVRRILEAGVPVFATESAFVGVAGVASPVFAAMGCPGFPAVDPVAAADKLAASKSAAAAAAVGFAAASASAIASAFFRFSERDLSRSCCSSSE